MVECFPVGSEDSLCEFTLWEVLSLPRSHSSLLIIKKLQLEPVMCTFIMAPNLLLVKCFPNIMIDFMADTLL